MYPGVDIIEIERFDKAVKRQPKLVERLFTPREQDYLVNKGVQSFAARFAGKEAVLKALGTGLSGLSWWDVEIINDASGEPLVILSDRAKEIASSRGCSQIRLSLSHNKQNALAMAILF